MSVNTSEPRIVDIFGIRSSLAERGGSREPWKPRCEQREKPSSNDDTSDALRWISGELTTVTSRSAQTVKLA
jgi:hypothetical protein